VAGLSKNDVTQFFLFFIKYFPKLFVLQKVRFIKQIFFVDDELVFVYFLKIVTFFSIYLYKIWVNSEWFCYVAEKQ